MKNSKVFQPKFIRKELKLGTKLWRVFLILGLNVALVCVLASLTLTHWSDVWHYFVIAGTYFLIIQYERTLDRWEDWVPPMVRGRRP